ncbi:hypothetical protein E3P99_02499 [Wallemia hederae]|uniref:Major facilitator superfamily (MFS) profile domain-containing protein n=1 Tax=Wallemia hederae TaxID=1540922 RepID=A0A4V6TMC7_9BASI|nr:hypothetical protein E3P99_02499 [Wallemia hederae]
MTNSTVLHSDTILSYNGISAPTKHPHDEQIIHDSDNEKSSDYKEDSIKNIDVDQHQLQPTSTDFATLRKVSDNVPVLTCVLIVLVEAAERFAYYGAKAPIHNYIQQPMPTDSVTGSTVHPGETAGALGLGQQAATGLGDFYTFWCYFTPLIGAIFGDTYGRYRTVWVSTGLYITGLIILTLTSIPPSLATGKAGPLAGLIVFQIISGLGTGGIKSQISVILAEQTNSSAAYVRTESTGERVIVDPNVTVQRLMNWFYWSINVGSLAFVVTPNVEKYHSFWLSYLVPTIVFLFIPVVLLILRHRLKRLPPRSSVILEAFRVMRLASFTGWRKGSSDASKWDVAKPTYYEQRQIAKPKAITWDDTFVYEVRRALKACTVFLGFIPFYIAGNQKDNSSSLSATMRQDGTPNDLLTVINPIFILAFIPFLDLVLYPFLRSRGIKFGPIARMTTGFFTSVLGLAYLACIQWYVYKISPCGHFATECTKADEKADLSLWVLAPVYALSAMGESFAAITAYEYTLTKAPVKMKSFITAIFLLQNAFGSAISIAFLPVSKDPYMIWLYGGTAIGYFVVVVVFYLAFRKLDKDNDVDNAVGKEDKRVN